MVPLYRFLVALLFALTLLADPGSHSAAVAHSYVDADLTAQQPQISVLSRRCPNLGNVQIPRGSGSCSLDLILDGAMANGRTCHSDRQTGYSPASDRPLSAWNAACPHGPPKSFS